MRRSLKAGVAALASVGACAGVTPPATAAEPSVVRAAESLQLDSRLGSVQTAVPLAPGVPYEVRIRGTYSAFSASLWNRPAGSWFVTCGSTEPAPMFHSPGVGSGAVGADAAVQFAGLAVRGCGNFRPPIASRLLEFDTGSGFQPAVPAGGPVTTPSPGHEYRYVVSSSGFLAPLKVRLADRALSDNYGVLHISVIHLGA